MSTSSLGLPQEEQDVEETVGALEKAIAAIETQLSTFFDVPADEVQSKLAQFEQAKLNIVKVYAINTLFYIFLKTQGINPNEHPVKKELERVKHYIKKIKDITDKGTKGASNANLKLNVDAAHRFIMHALQPTSSEQQQQSQQTLPQPQPITPSQTVESIDAEEGDVSSPLPTKHQQKQHQKQSQQKQTQQQQQQQQSQQKATKDRNNNSSSDSFHKKNKTSPASNKEKVFNSTQKKRRT